MQAADTPLIGAEAIVGPVDFLGRKALEKRRVAKAWRHPRLDHFLRDARTRDEANLLIAARRAGIPVPLLFEADRADATLVLERIEGRLLRDVLEKDADTDAQTRIALLGRLVATMHDAGLTHGDLTTSNVLVPRAGGLVLIDFGLGQATREDEPRAVDLHLVEQALAATDPRADALVRGFLAAYAQAECAPGVMKRLEALRERGRYR